MASEEPKFSINNEVVTKVYKRRFYMQFLFSFLSLLCGMLFPQYVSIANVNMCYYNISINTLNYTVYMMMASYFIFVFPMSLLMNYIGLRWTVILGALTNTAACAIQFLGLKPDGFSFILISSVFSSASNLLVLAVPPFLAATWFPNTELSRACAAGVFGNQLGVAIGYLFSPLITPNDCSDKAAIEAGKLKGVIILSILNSLWLLLIVFTFQNAPKCPPNLSNIEKIPAKEHAKSALKMFKSSNFVMLFIMYGLMVGSYFAILTVLNDLVLRYFPHQEKAIGWMGSLFIIAGLVGSIIAGFVLDYTHKFKETTLVICIASLITYIVFGSSLFLENLSLTFFTIVVSGFFLTSFLPVGIEYGIELTFPEPEVISSSLLNGSTCLIGMILTEATSSLLQKFGPIASNIAVSIFILTSFIITIFITKQYKRSEKYAEKNLSTENQEEIRNDIKFVTKM